MIKVDTFLIHQARRLVTGANVHRMKEMIFAYEQAVSLYNSGVHKRYDPTCEERLRQSVHRGTPPQRYAMRGHSGW